MGTHLICFLVSCLLTIEPQSRQGTEEERQSIHLEAGKSVDVLVEYTNTPSEIQDGPQNDGVEMQPALMRGVVNRTPAFLCINSNNPISVSEDVRNLTRRKR